MFAGWPLDLKLGAGCCSSTRAYLQPQVSQYARWTSGFSTEESRAVLSVNVFMVALLILICSNVALDDVFRETERGSDPVARCRLSIESVAPNAAPGPWYEIVGTVKDLGMVADPSERAGALPPMARGSEAPIHMAVHVGGNIETFAPRLYALATAVDPTLRLYDLMPLDRVGSSRWLEFGYLYRVLIAVSAIARRRRSSS
jgi:hypothetical protein